MIATAYALLPAVDLLARPSQHGSGLDELLFLVVPMIIFGVVFLLAMRSADRQSGLEDETGSAEAGDPPESGEPEP